MPSACFLQYYNYRAISFAACLFIALVSCQSNVSDFHPQYFDRFQKQLDTTFNVEQRIAIADSAEVALHRFPAGAGDWVWYYRLRLECQLGLHDYRNAFLFLDSADQILEKRLGEKKFLDLYINGLIDRSYCYMRMKNFDAALHYLVKAKEVSNSSNPCDLSAFSGHMANLFYNLHRFRIAAAYFHQSVNYMQLCGNSPHDVVANVQGNLDNIAICYLRAELYDSAAFYCQYTLDYISRNERFFTKDPNFISLAKAVVKGNYGKVKRKEKLHAEAEKLDKESIAVTEGVYADYTLDMQFELINLYLEWDKPGEAEQLLEKLDLLHHFRERGNLEESRMVWNLAMQKLWAKKGDTAKALEHNTNYLILRDSLDLTEKNNISRDVGRELENKEQRSANLLLKKQNEQQSFQLIIALLLSVMAIGTMVFTWYSLQRKAKHVKSLERLNNEIIIKNDDLGKAFAALEESQADNTKITRMVAHDLKNPIGGIRNLVHSMLKKQQPAESRAILEVIQTSCNNSLLLINELIKEKTSSEQNHEELVDIHRVLQYCVNMLQTKADEKNQRLNLQGDRLMIAVNREKMWRVISNLLNNAIKFSPENTVINVNLRKNGEKVLFSVEDHGIGIPEALRDKIFTLQPEASRMGTAGEESHGLGLFISQKIVTEHKGRIWFESNNREGSTFYVELPGVN